MDQAIQKGTIGVAPGQQYFEPVVSPSPMSHPNMESS